jgi:16S rRNA G966 N2-methylase RsmD
MILSKDIKHMTEIQQYFEKFKNMKPYFEINEEEWSYIKETFPKEDVKEVLVDILMNYPLPTAEISEVDAYNDFMKLKGIRWNELLVEGAWFPRKASESKYPLTFGGKQQYIRRLNTGNNASNHFQQENRWGVDGTVSPGPKRTWENRNFMVTLMGGLYTLKFPKVGRNELRVCISLRKYICSLFKPNVAKALYDMVGAKNVLDISAGWGDRLCGFMASEKGEHYVGIDPRRENHPIYEQQAEFYKKHNGFFETDKKATFHCSPAEDMDYSDYTDYFDIVFSSPPYFNVERYSYDDTQSWVRYNNIDVWNKLFLHKTIEKVWPTIRKGGYLAINIADVYATSKGDGKGYQEITNPMNDYISSLGGEYEGCLGMEMAKRPGSAGAGAIIEGDEYKYTEEALLKAEEAKNKTFCEPVWIWKKL